MEMKFETETHYFEFSQNVLHRNMAKGLDFKYR